MKKLILLGSIALLCASLAWAQQTAATSDQSGSGTSSSPSSGTIQGCVSGTDGNYMLTQDETGAMYKLVGNEDKLKNHVGHDVMITGQLTSAPDQGQSGSSTSNAGANGDGGSVIQVSDVKMIAKQCSRGSNSQQ